LFKNKQDILGKFNKIQFALNSLTELVSNIKAKHELISFNSEGFIALDEMKNMLEKIGKVKTLETTYNTFCGCRNLARNLFTKVIIYINMAAELIILWGLKYL
jgi:adenine-specific DNA-methyltransferase